MVLTKPIAKQQTSNNFPGPGKLLEVCCFAIGLVKLFGQITVYQVIPCQFVTATGTLYGAQNGTIPTCICDFGDMYSQVSHTCLSRICCTDDTLALDDTNEAQFVLYEDDLG
jgi:hypothetical protein